MAERVIRSIREECLDKLLILNQRHLSWVMQQYLTYYNHRRPHQGLHQQLPWPCAAMPTTPTALKQVQCQRVLGGIIKDYKQAA